MSPSHLEFLRRLAVAAGVVLVTYFAVAYIVMPRAWKRHARRHPELASAPRVTHTGSGIPADPVNVALAGTEAEVLSLLLAAKWYPADPLTLKSSLKIAAASVLKREYETAPVSNLYLFKRPEDLAFEQPVGSNPRERHHVRFWQTDQVDLDGRPVWVGAAIFDRRVGLSRTTGQITHKTAPDIDTERDKLFADLTATGELAESFDVPDFHQMRSGRNGGGDSWHTDGALKGGVIRPKK